MMLNRLDERLMRAKEQVRAKQKLESILRQARITAEAERSRCSALKDALMSEESDVRRLEGLSLTGLFYSVLGTKDERLETERQEFLAAKLKHEGAVAAWEEARAEVKRIQRELDALMNAEAEHQELLQEKERLLLQSGGQTARRLLALAEQLADLNSDKRELDEAIEAGQAAISSLQRVNSELQSAANWGTWDMLGGGMLSTMAKHSKIDSAKQYALQAQRNIRRFQEELSDAGRRLHVSLEIGGFSKFADYFFDGLIADWVVQSRIQEASSACSLTRARVSAAVSACRRRLAEVEQEIGVLTKERGEIVERE